MVAVDGAVGKHAVDSFIREIELTAVFVLTGNFYENLVLRGHMQYDSDRDALVFKQAIIKANAQRMDRLTAWTGRSWYADDR
jgi:hypothetical protein